MEKVKDGTMSSSVKKERKDLGNGKGKSTERFLRDKNVGGLLITRCQNRPSENRTVLIKKKENREKSVINAADDSRGGIDSKGTDKHRRPLIGWGTGVYSAIEKGGRHTGHAEQL